MQGEIEELLKKGWMNQYDLFQQFANVALTLFTAILISTQFFSIGFKPVMLAPVFLMCTLTPLQFHLIKDRELVFADQIVVMEKRLKDMVREWTDVLDHWQMLMGNYPGSPGVYKYEKEFNKIT